MNITLSTIAKRPTYTIGRLYINGHYYCDTLEPPYVELNSALDKLDDGTAIPQGNYPIVLSYSSKFHRTMPFLAGVPYFSGIMIHPGNTVTDTRGCILVGKNTIIGRLTQSRATFEPLITLIKHKIRDDDGFVTVTVKR